MTILRSQSSERLLLAAIAAITIAAIAMYADTARSLIAIWNSSETYAHGYLILPLSAWLIWKRRHSLAVERIEPCWPALVALLACGFGWLLADLGDVQVIRQYAFVAMIPLAITALLGWRVAYALALPLAFLLFAVPFGDVFIAPLIDFTANFTVTALQLTGIPVLRSGNSFQIPSGDWSVVEACSGVRYLISSITLGCLYAALTYRSRVRQAMFILLSIAVPIVANGLRAYMIVMIGHLSGMKLAVGVDHLIYGWLFFGLVMFLMFWIGSFWREDELPPAETPMTAPAKETQWPSSAAMIGSALSIVVVLAAWPAYARYLLQKDANAMPARLQAFQANWQERQPFTSWRPHFLPASANLYRFYEHGTENVGVAILYYRNQRHGAELISSSNRLIPEKDAFWHITASTMRDSKLPDRALRLREVQLEGNGQSMLVWQWYWIDGRFTANDYIGKMLQARQKLLQGGDDGAALMLFAPFNGHADDARAAMHEFLRAHLGAIETTLNSNRMH